MILDDLVTATKQRLIKEKSQVSLVELKQRAQQIPNRDSQAVINKFLEPELHFIGEIKKASPSKGTIVKDFPYMKIAQEYQKAEIDAISVLTEPTYFQGKLDYLKEISKTTNVPLLRKDFTIDPYMIYQAKIAGASMILLIVAILDDEQLSSYLNLTKQLGLAALVEVHNENELQRALNAGAEIIGVNNRNLKDFTVDLNNSLKLRSLVPKQIPFITESGIKTIADIKKLKQAQVNGVLIGETFMKASDRIKIIREFQSV